MFCLHRLYLSESRSFMPWRLEEGTLNPPEVESQMVVRHHGCQKLNLHPLEKQPVLLTAKPGSGGMYL